MDHFSAFMMAATFLYLLWEIRKLYFAASSKKWKEVTGTVLTAEIGEHNDGESRSPRYTAKVRYSYKISGATYESTNLTYANQSGRQSDAIQLLIGVSPGRSISVYYDSRNPANSALVVGYSNGNLVSIAICIVILLAIYYYF